MGKYLYLLEKAILNYCLLFAFNHFKQLSVSLLTPDSRSFGTLQVDAVLEQLLDPGELFTTMKLY
jgi:hypothetical protein